MPPGTTPGAVELPCADDHTGDGSPARARTPLEGRRGTFLCFGLGSSGDPGRALYARFCQPGSRSRERPGPCRAWEAALAARPTIT
jgi:hypothetical protein